MDQYHNDHRQQKSPWRNPRGALRRSRTNLPSHPSADLSLTADRPRFEWLVVPNLLFCLFGG